MRFLKDKEAVHPSGEWLVFNSDDHSYLMNGKVPLTSVTRFINNFFEKFDTEKASRKYSLKHGLRQQDVIKMWEERGREARELGNRVHFYAECLVKGENLPKPTSGKESVFYKVVDNSVSKLLAKYELVEAEKIVFDPANKIAGTIDLILKDNDNGDIVVFDWKTSKEIKTSNPWQSGRPPIRHLQDCNYNHYSLQLNFYKKILRDENYYPGCGYRIGIGQLTPGGMNWLKIKSMDNEVADMIAW
ncbi:MAG: hypothetical protein HN931_04745 [Desulfobacterales bacterium]|jgi:ATP-dependent exoDNAse (exonuclease V) beta subunit|nr:hypothetical protein [Desulfobacteraceae bacterium]MBT7085461.1 hypothetical protein [Desulfobacterales bacterium]